MENENCLTFGSLRFETMFPEVCALREAEMGVEISIAGNTIFRYSRDWFLIENPMAVEWSHIKLDELEDMYYRKIVEKEPERLFGLFF